MFSGLNDSPEEKIMLRPKKKSVKCMVDWMSKCCKVRELVLDTGSGALLTARARLQLQKLQMFVGCEKTSTTFRDELLSLLGV